MNKVYYTWKDFEEDVGNIKAVIEENKITHIVTLYRGGLTLGVKLSNVCKLPLSIVDYQSYDGKSKEPIVIKDAGIKKEDTILIVDDIIDTGNSIKNTQEVFKENNVIICSIYGNNKVHDKKWLYCKEHKNEWVIFPWE